MSNILPHFLFECSADLFSVFTSEINSCEMYKLNFTFRHKHIVVFQQTSVICVSLLAGLEKFHCDNKDTDRGQTAHHIHLIYDTK